MKSLNTLTAYVIGVLIMWSVIFAVGYFRHGSTFGHPLPDVFGGFLLGRPPRVHLSRRSQESMNPSAGFLLLKKWSY
jgi:hypothetical protein